MSYSLTQDEVRKLFRYNKRTGRLVWRRRGNPSFDTQNAGREAGHVDRRSHTSYRYVTVGRDGKIYRVLAHKIIWLYVAGEWAREVDHKNHNGLDNRWANLRACSRRLNCLNRKAARGTQRVSRNRYQASIESDGKAIYLGLFATEKEAHMAYVKKRKELISKEEARYGR